jgi:glycosyltransferase involved in cell wall biosynthesis
MAGISFIVRVRNEEATLEESLTSLKRLTIPHDIHVILNLCTDRSREIAEKLQKEGMPIHIHAYDIPLSRAGYEMLITDAESPHSFVQHSKWCYSKATHTWKFRWDADFIASPALIEYLNRREWSVPEKPTIIKITYVSPDVSNSEGYLFTGDFSIIKYVFWEYCQLEGDHVTEDLAPEIHIQHKSVLWEMKKYWKEPCWFWPDPSDEAAELRRKYHALVALCGSEPQGQARASNPSSANIFCQVRDNEEKLKSHGIHFWN